MTAPSDNWIGQSIERIEDNALPSGRGRFVDGLAVRPGTLHAAILRSQHAHALARAIRVERVRHVGEPLAIVVAADRYLAEDALELIEVDYEPAFRRHHALQCRFCTAGILMSLDWYLRERPDPSEDELRKFFGGHLCRCIGYVPIIAAALDAARRIREVPDA
jgi:hypothetical protein